MRAHRRRRAFELGLPFEFRFYFFSWSCIRCPRGRTGAHTRHAPASSLARPSPVRCVRVVPAAARSTPRCAGCSQAPSPHAGHRLRTPLRALHAPYLRFSAQRARTASFFHVFTTNTAHRCRANTEHTRCLNLNQVSTPYRHCTSAHAMLISLLTSASLVCISRPQPRKRQSCTHSIAFSLRGRVSRPHLLSVGAVAQQGGGGVVRLHRGVEGGVAVNPTRLVVAGEPAEQAGQRGLHAVARREEGEHARGEGPTGEARVGVR